MKGSLSRLSRRLTRPEAPSRVLVSRRWWQCSTLGTQKDFSNLQNFEKETKTESETETEIETEGQGRTTVESAIGTETETENQRTTTAGAEIGAETGTAETPKAKRSQRNGRCPLRHCHRGEDNPRRPLLEHASSLVVSQFLLVQAASRGKAVASSQLQVKGVCGAQRWRRIAHLQEGRSPMGLGRRPQTERLEGERPPRDERQPGSEGEVELAPRGKVRTTRREKEEGPA